MGIGWEFFEDTIDRAAFYDKSMIGTNGFIQHVAILEPLLFFSLVGSVKADVINFLTANGIAFQEST
jgi:hypothetical protein